MINNIWFYTLSTSAQVLAALAGLFAVFVVWKMQDIEKTLLEIRFISIKLVSEISSNTKDYTRIKIKDLYSMSNSEILTKFSELLFIKNNEPARIQIGITISGNNNGSAYYSLDEFTKDTYESQILNKDSILKNLKKILVSNFSVISICVIALTLSNIIPYKLIVLIVISIAVLYCLYLISNSIYKITIK